MRERTEVDEALPCYAGQPVLWSEYTREEIAPIFGTSFNSGNWNCGIVRLTKDLILLTTLKKEDLSVGGHYDDGFLSPSRMRWQSQTRTQRDSRVGKILAGMDRDARIHLFVRSEKLRNGKGAPFLYCGQPKFVSWDGEEPITVQWSLPEPVPIHLRKSLAVPDN